MKILIIKLGYSETMHHHISRYTSYGDVLRSTVLLHLYKDDDVSWLVDEKAAPILKDNPYIDRILHYDPSTILQLQAERFDTVINLEKTPGICALADSIDAWRRYGFRFDAEKGIATAYNGTHTILDLCQNDFIEFAYNEPIQKGLYEMVGKVWDEQEYVIDYDKGVQPEFGIGLNWSVGNKFEGKAWPEEHWDELAGLCTQEDMKVSWQEPDGGLESYFKWINSCGMIISNDSFGLHVAIAMKKKVIGLFAVTNPNQVYFYGRGCAIVPNAEVVSHSSGNYQALHKPKLEMKNITPTIVFEKIKELNNG